MNASDYIDLKTKLVDLGYAEEIDWAEDVQPCQNSLLFAQEAVWVILSSSMKNQIAKKIQQRIYHAINNGQPVSSAFGHRGKVKAIEYILENKERLFCEYQQAKDKIENPCLGLETLRNIILLKISAWMFVNLTDILYE